MKNKIYFFLSLLGIIAFCVFYLISENLCTEKRYSFDFGSASIKAKGALIDKCKSVILEELGNTSENNKIINCITHAEVKGKISEQCITNAIKAVKNIERHLGINCKIDKCAGIATAWARKASNGIEVINAFNALNIKTELVSQEIEGSIGFYTALADSETKHVHKNNIVVWDIGGGSFQLSTLTDDGKVHVYNGPWGIETFEQLIRKKLGIFQMDELPYFDNSKFDLAVQVATDVLGKPIMEDPVIYKKLKNPSTVVFAIGRPMRLGLELEMDLNSEPRIDEILEVAAKYKGMTIHEITTKVFKNLPQFLAPTGQIIPIAIYGIMNGAGINKISIIDSPINDYVLIEPRFWDNP